MHFPTGSVAECWYGFAVLPSLKNLRDSVLRVHSSRWAPEGPDGHAYDVAMNEEPRENLRFLTVEQAAQEQLAARGTLGAQPGPWPPR